jgi:hypothetical protein
VLDGEGVQVDDADDQLVVRVLGELEQGPDRAEVVADLQPAGLIPAFAGSLEGAGTTLAR